MGSLKLPSDAFVDSDEECLTHLMMTNFPGFDPKPWKDVGTDPRLVLGSGLTEQWALARESLVGWSEVRDKVL